MKYILTILVILCTCFVSVAEITLSERKMKLKSFPCMNCHGDFLHDEISQKKNFTKPHENLKFKHMDSIKNCYSCHDKKDRDLLVLNNGKKVGFDESYKQCFQCHGEKKRDWENGTHGKQIGSWNGDKYKLVCASCHNPHHPKFPQMKADPGPKHPKGKQTGEH